MAVVAGVDSSTQSTKVELRRLDDGAVVWRAANPHPPTTPPRSEQDPEAWWAALRPLLDGAWAAARRAGEPGVAAVAVAAQQHGMVVLGDRGQVLHPAKLWNDTEAAPDCPGLVEALGGPAAAARAVGSVPGPAFTLSKLAWLRRVAPATHAAVRTVLLPHDWLTWRLSGQQVTDHGDASGTGYYSPTDRAWAPGALAAVGLGPEVLPRLAAGAEVVGTVGPLAVAAGTGDNMAAALGMGLQPGDVALSFGTSGTAFCRSERPAADPTGTVAGFADATGHFLPLVCTLNATRVTDTVGRLLGAGPQQLDELALSSPPGAGGLTLVPYFDGERTPDRPWATGTLSGLRTASGAADLARAAVEGVVCSLLEGLEALQAAVAAGPDAPGPGAVAPGPAGGGRVLLAGGGARSAAYRQVVADLLGRPVVAPGVSGDRPDGPPAELVAAGACVLAAAAATGRPPSAVAGEWQLDRGLTVHPAAAVDGAAVRAAWRRARDLAGPPPVGSA